LTSRIQKSSSQHCLTPWALKVTTVYSLQMSGISNPSTVWSNQKDLSPQTTVYFNSFGAGGFCKDCLKILVRLRVITVQNAVLGDVTPCCSLSWRWRQNSSICLPDVMASRTRRDCPWFKNWISTLQKTVDIVCETYRCTVWAKCIVPEYLSSWYMHSNNCALKTCGVKSAQAGVCWGISPALCGNVTDTFIMWWWCLKCRVLLCCDGESSSEKCVGKDLVFLIIFMKTSCTGGQIIW